MNVQAEVHTQAQVVSKLEGRPCEAPSPPRAPLLAKPLLIPLTNLAVFSTVTINHLSPLLPFPPLSSAPLSTLPPHHLLYFPAVQYLHSSGACSSAPASRKRCSDEITPIGLMARMQ